MVFLNANMIFFTTSIVLIKKNQCSLSSGCNALIEDGLLGGVDIDNRFWLDIDTPEALHYAMATKS